jgi:hypothetical protein
VSVVPSAATVVEAAMTVPPPMKPLKPKTMCQVEAYCSAVVI